ncbi:LytR C-terminal domain-containing protein [Haloechinothrix salitolerans]|uniref:LytR C-terminal domain-containing protein n=1 Tax=Haloechinothrix salitolerans TaxID=926830 RepID=A0ABW2BTZ2_9PSEU
MNLPGLSRPLRAAGLALVGVAVIAVAIGTVTVITGDADEAAAPSGEQTTTTAPGEGDGGESPTSAPGSPSESPSDAVTESETATSEPDDGASDGSDGSDAGKDGAGAGDGAGDGGKATDRPGGKDDVGSGKDGSALWEMVDVRVYNNSKISGLATRASRDLEARGWDVVETGNYSDGVIYTTTVYYREGTNEEAAAQAIGENFSMRVRPRFDGIKDASPGVIVIVTKDYEGREAGK